MPGAGAHTRRRSHGDHPMTERGGVEDMGV